MIAKFSEARNKRQMELRTRDVVAAGRFLQRNAERGVERRAVPEVRAQAEARAEERRVFHELILDLLAPDFAGVEECVERCAAPRW